MGIPPVLHMGSCVDNSRILIVLTAMATEGGLGDDIATMPAVGVAPEWMSEKAVAIAVYAGRLRRIRHDGRPQPGAFRRRGDRHPLDGVGRTLRRQAGVRRRGLGNRQEDAGSTSTRSAPVKLPVYDATRFGASGDDEDEGVRGAAAGTADGGDLWVGW